MTFNELTREAARLANTAVAGAMSDMAGRHTYDEDDVTPGLVGRLHSTFENANLEGIQVKATVLRHRKGRAAEEKKFGADLLVHVSLDTDTQSYSKGVLIQSKKLEREDYWSSTWRNKLINDCETMLKTTCASFVFSYSERGMRCGAATRVSGALAKAPVSLRYLCGWTSYRFFLELFRCPIGDPNITSARVDELPVPLALALGFKGHLDLDKEASTY